MTLEEMEKDHRNKIDTRSIICDPCQDRKPRLIGGNGTISGYCLLKPHNPLYCPWPEDCQCDCHKRPPVGATNATKPDLIQLVQAEEQRRGFSQGHRSFACWGDNHNPTDCKNVWCDCWCHKAETGSDRLARSTPVTTHGVIVSTPPLDTSVKVGDKIGHKIMFTDEEGHTRQVILLPSGEIMEIQ